MCHPSGRGRSYIPTGMHRKRGMFYKLTAGLPMLFLRCSTSSYRPTLDLRLPASAIGLRVLPELGATVRVVFIPGHSSKDGEFPAHYAVLEVRVLAEAIGAVVFSWHRRSLPRRGCRLLRSQRNA